MAQYRSGTLRQSKVTIIVDAAAPLDEEESRAAEDLCWAGRPGCPPAGCGTRPPGAVMEAAAGKARQRREEAARDARAERWAEDSGNAALMGRELPPAEVLAAGQRITAWAHQLRKAAAGGPDRAGGPGRAAGRVRPG